MYTAKNGIPFNVRIVKTGDRYGLHDQLIHEKPGAMVEFYDARNPEFDETGNKRGQFVSRYYWRTIRNHLKTGQGICLHGAYPDTWSIDGETLGTILRDVAQFIE